MDAATMGRVIVTAMIENVADLYNANQGVLPADQVRRVEVTDALVDTGASTLSMPGAPDRVTRPYPSTDANRPHGWRHGDAESIWRRPHCCAGPGMHL